MAASMLVLLPVLILFFVAQRPVGTGDRPDRIKG